MSPVPSSSSILFCNDYYARARLSLFICSNNSDCLTQCWRRFALLLNIPEIFPRQRFRRGHCFHLWLSRRGRLLSVDPPRISHKKLQLHDLTFNIWHIWKSASVTVRIMYEINGKHEQYVIAILCRYILNSMFCKTLNTVFHVQILQAIELQAKICEDFL